jgi:cytochrome c oxidase subunit 2
MLQDIAWIVSLLAIAVVGILFVWVARSAGQKTEPGPVAQATNRIRGPLFYVLVAVIVAVSAYSLTDLPYAAPAGMTGPTQVINATGQQWAWQLDRTQVTAGQPVEFRVTGSDVNHGFGLYDENGTLVAQTQAMPGYVNVLYQTFDKPGKYRVLCLEYCGVAHHVMAAEIEVVAP